MKTQFDSRRRLIFRICMLIVLLLVGGMRLTAQEIKTYQAENAEMYKAEVENEHAGFTGSGYVNFENEPGGYLEFAVFMAETDTQRIYIRYANGATSARPMQVQVDSTILEAMPNFDPTDAWTNWDVDSIDVFLVPGENRVRFTGTTSDGGPNIDKLDVTGTPGVVYYDLTLSVIGRGVIESTPPGTNFEAATLVELQAIADSGWQFLEWRGDSAESANPLTLLMNSNKELTAVFSAEYDTAFQFGKSPIGFASVDSLGQNGTNGGKGGDTTVVTTGEALFLILDDRRDPDFERNLPPRVLLIDGKLTWDGDAMLDVKETYDLSIMGKGSDAQIEGFGLNIFRSHNIIIRNIEFRDCPDDCINITDPLSHHVWIDHCTFSDSPDSDPGGDRHDGLLDIKHGASFITVSWNHFYNHQKTALLGHSDGNADEDVGRLKVTYHHNWWDNTGSRHPRVRFGEVHVYNNYYDNSQQKMGYGIASTMEADVVIESNYFEKVPHPTYVGYGSSAPGDIIEINNLYEDSGTPEIRGTAFNPVDYYTYQLDDPSILPALLMTYAGSGKMGEIVNVVEAEKPKTKPIKFTLSQNFPNPFNATTAIRYRIPQSGRVILKVYNMTGREITQLVQRYQEAGEYVVEFDASSLSSGLYIYRLSTGGYHITRKMMLLK